MNEVRQGQRRWCWGAGAMQCWDFFQQKESIFLQSMLQCEAHFMEVMRFDVH